MKKNIIIIIQTVLMVLLFVFAFIQKLEADKQAEIAKLNLIEAQRQEQLLVAERRKAEETIVQLQQEIDNLKAQLKK